MNENKSLDQHLKEAEINRVKAETKKIELENKELQKSWFKGKYFFQAIITGLIAVPLIWFYLINIALPIHSKDNIELAWNISVAQDSLNKAKKQFKKDIISLKQEKITQKNEYILGLQEIRYERSKLDSAYKALSVDYKNLSNTFTLNQKERERFRNKFTSLESKLINKEQRISVLNQKIELAKQTGGHNLVPVTLDTGRFEFTVESTVTDSEGKDLTSQPTNRPLEFTGNIFMTSTIVPGITSLSFLSIRKEQLYHWFETSKGIIYLHMDDLKEIKETYVDSEN